MKRTFNQMGFLCIICVVIGSLLILNQGSLENQYEGIVRFHVIGNSDEKFDQRTKEAVRDAILQDIEEELRIRYGREWEGFSIDEKSEITRNYVKNNLREIKGWTVDYLEEHDIDYGARVVYGVRRVPEKKYGDIVFPEGNYEALTISLGEGKGKNWWCVIFPPLCLIDNSKNSKGEGLYCVDDEERIVLKSKIKEIIEKKQKKFVKNNK